MSKPQQQNPDGSFSEAVPLGWQGAEIDWEVYTKPAGYEACGYDEDVLVHVVKAATKEELATGIQAFLDGSCG